MVEKGYIPALHEKFKFIEIIFYMIQANFITHNLLQEPFNLGMDFRRTIEDYGQSNTFELKGFLGVKSRIQALIYDKYGLP
jgi:hypothetical protein